MNENWLLSLEGADEKVEFWHRHYNTDTTMGKGPTAR